MLAKMPRRRGEDFGWLQRRAVVDNHAAPESKQPVILAGSGPAALFSVHHLVATWNHWRALRSVHSVTCHSEHIFAHARKSSRQWPLLFDECFTCGNRDDAIFLISSVQSDILTCARNKCFIMSSQDPPPNGLPSRFVGKMYLREHVFYTTDECT